MAHVIRDELYGAVSFGGGGGGGGGGRGGFRDSQVRIGSGQYNNERTVTFTAAQKRSLATNAATAAGVMMGAGGPTIAVRAAGGALGVYSERNR